MGGKNVVAQLKLNNSAKVMPQAGIITIPLEAVFIYGIGNINRLRFKIACYFFISIYGTVTQFFFNAEQLVVFRHTVATAQ